MRRGCACRESPSPGNLIDTVAFHVKRAFVICGRDVLPRESVTLSESLMSERGDRPRQPGAASTVQWGMTLHVFHVKRGLTGREAQYVTASATAVAMTFTVGK